MERQIGMVNKVEDPYGEDESVARSLLLLVDSESTVRVLS